MIDRIDFSEYDNKINARIEVETMSEPYNREELEHAARAAMDQQEEEANKEPYVERPKSLRIFAWVLFGILLVGIALYYFWIAKGGLL